MMLLFGEMLDSLGDAADGMKELKTFSFYMLYIGIGTMVFAGL